MSLPLSGEKHLLAAFLFFGLSRTKIFDREDEATRYFETSVDFFRTTRRYNGEDCL
jgi:hypothetical protein